MNAKRAITSGILIWILIFINFTIFSFIPVIKNSELQQNLILYVLLIPIVIVGMKYYYKKGNKTNGLTLGVILSITSLLLDASITVPFVIIPHGGNYNDFFVNPLLWITTAELILISFFYWKTKIK